MNEIDNRIIDDPCKTTLENNHEMQLLMHMDTISRIIQQYVLTESEDDIISQLLHNSLHISQALGASFVPLDDHGIPMTAISESHDISTTQLDDWVEYLAAPAIRIQCNICRKDHIVSESCPLLSNPFDDTLKMFCITLRKKKTKVGVLNLYLLKSIILDPVTRNLLQIIVDTATLAIYGLRLKNKQQKKISRLRKNLIDIDPRSPIIEELRLKTTLEERSRLAREIHDGIAQILGYVKLQLSQIKQYLQKGDFHEISALVDSSYTAVSEAYLDAREAIDDLHVDQLCEDFSSWMQRATADFEENTSLKIELTGLPSRWVLSPQIQIHLTRIVQEVLSNIRKHAQAKLVQISYHQEEHLQTIEICDDGVGFLVDEATGTSQHGLRSMRERAELIDVELYIESNPGKGTSVIIQIPVSEVRQGD